MPTEAPARTLAERRRALARAQARAQAQAYLRAHPHTLTCPLAHQHGHLLGRPAAWSRSLA